MNYRLDKYGNKISLLGYGCMRFTRTKGKLDIDKAEQEVLEAFRSGVNYYDTAYIYPGNESLMGEIFERTGIREQIYIATKLPHYLIQNENTLEKLFQEQLKRLRTDYIDYYLVHMLNDIETWTRLKSLGIIEWIQKKKASGEIRQIGFSYHGTSDMFCQLINSYDWDFCQIQYNYMDEHSQAGRKGLYHAASKGIPVVIMEPLRGGKLVANLPDEAKRIFKKYPQQYSPAQWALRWLFNQPEVTCVLSGMNSLAMVRENVLTASTSNVGDLGSAEEAMLKDVVNAIKSTMKVGCTGCGYCMPCPKNVDIPGTFSSYNGMALSSKFSAFWDHVKCSAMKKNPTGAFNCISCGKCEKHCPQHIEIRKELKNVEKELEGPLYRFICRIVKIFKAY